MQLYGNYIYSGCQIRELLSAFKYTDGILDSLHCPNPIEILCPNSTFYIVQIPLEFIVQILYFTLSKSHWNFIVQIPLFTLSFAFYRLKG